MHKNPLRPSTSLFGVRQVGTLLSPLLHKSLHPTLHVKIEIALSKLKRLHYPTSQPLQNITLHICTQTQRAAKRPKRRKEQESDSARSQTSYRLYIKTLTGYLNQTVQGYTPSSWTDGSSKFPTQLQDAHLRCRHRVLPAARARDPPASA